MKSCPTLPSSATLHRCLLMGLLCFLSCHDRGVELPAVSAPPSILSFSLAPLEGTPLSAEARLHTRDASGVFFELLTDSLPFRLTPFIPLLHDSARMSIVGLRAQTTHRIRAVALAPDGTTSFSNPLPFTTAPLPDEMPGFILHRSRNSTLCYVLLGITPARNGKSFAVAVDRNGDVVWYREFREAVLDVQKQPNGLFTAWTAEGTGMFYEFDSFGRTTRTFRASDGRDTGPHELRLLPDGHVLFGIEFRILDLTSVGGRPNASVRGLSVEYHRSSGPPLIWKTFDNLSITDASPDIDLTGANVNPWHGNAIEIDTDGNLLVSWRNHSEITKIDATTGQILWRMGGKRNQFAFLNDAGFSHQHGIRRLSNGNLILFDNGNLHTPPESRAVEYRVDEQSRTVERVWEYRASPPLFGFALGFAQRLPGGTTLISFGTAQRIVEVGPDGTLLWELELTEQQRFAYRAIAIESLY